MANNAIKSNGCDVKLRIKEVFLRAIVDGSKRFEYRDFKPYYKVRLNRKAPFALKLYCGKKFVWATVSSIKIIRTPAHLKQSNIPFSNKVFQLELKEIVEVRGL